MWATRVLSFVAPPDFEAPGDVGTDNVYNVQIQVTDGTNPVTQDLTVTVTNDVADTIGIVDIFSPVDLTVQTSSSPDLYYGLVFKDFDGDSNVDTGDGWYLDVNGAARSSTNPPISFSSTGPVITQDSTDPNTYTWEWAGSDGYSAQGQFTTDGSTGVSGVLNEGNLTAHSYTISGPGVSHTIDLSANTLDGNPVLATFHDIQFASGSSSFTAPSEVVTIADIFSPVDLTVQTTTGPDLYYGLVFKDFDGDGSVDTGDGWYLDVNGAARSTTNPPLSFSATGPVITQVDDTNFTWEWEGSDGYTASGQFTILAVSGLVGAISEAMVTAHTYTVAQNGTDQFTIDLINETLDVAGVSTPVLATFHDFEFTLSEESFTTPSEVVTINDPEYPVDLTLETADTFYYGLFFDDVNADGTIDSGDGWFLDIRGSEDGIATPPVSFSNNGPVITQVDDTTYTWEWTGSNGYTASGEFSVLAAANLVGTISEDQITEHTYTIFQNGVEQFTIDLVNETIAGVEEEIVESYHDLEFTLGSTGFEVPAFDPENASLDVEEGDEQRGIITLLTSLTLSLTLTSNATSFANELVAFVVEDDQGTVRDAEGNTITPGTEGFSQTAYLEAILAARSTQVVLSNLNTSDTDLPDVLPDAFGEANLDGEVTFTEGTRVAFFLVVNGTADDLQVNPSALDVFFSNLNGALIEDLTSSGFNLSFGDDEAGIFDDLTFTVNTLPDQANNSIAPGQLNQLGKSLRIVTEAIDDFVEVFDFRTFDQDGDGVADTDGNYQVVINIYSEAAYDNLLGFYVVNPNDGSVAGITPSAANRQAYIDAVLANALGTTTDIQNEDTRTFNVPIAAGSVVVPFIIANSTEVNGDYSNIYFPLISLNSDRVDHVRGFGNGIFGLEDLPGGGDQDFDDIIIQITTVTVNLA